MENTRLATLLERSPLSEEDRYNIATIFSVLTPERQGYILDNWESYLIEMVMIRKEVDSANKALLEEAIEMSNTLHDSETAQEAEMRLKKFRQQREIRKRELEGVNKYHQTTKLNLIRTIAQIENNK